MMDILLDAVSHAPLAAIVAGLFSWWISMMDVLLDVLIITSLAAMVVIFFLATSRHSGMRR